MPRFRRNERRNHAQSINENYIPFYNARLFAMHESLIQSYAHFTYHANYMFNALGQSLHSVRNPQPWSFIPLSQSQPQRQQPQYQQPQYQPPQYQQPQYQQPQYQQPQYQQPQYQQPQYQQQQPRQPQPQPRQPQPHQQPQQPQSHAIPLSANAAPFRSNATTVLENSIVNALIGMLYHPEEQRLTRAELDERVELTRFENIIHPLNTICSITHDEFEPSQQVARIRHCGHIFNSDSLAHWLRLNNTCPSCRHNLRDSPNATTTNATATNAATTNATTTNATTTNATATNATTANNANATATNATATNATNATNATTTNATATNATNASNATNATTTNATTTNATTTNATNIINMRRILEIPLESEISINTFYNDLIRNRANIPGFELNAVDDDSIVFSFDLMSDRRNGSGSGTGQGPAGQGSGNIDEVD